MSFVLSNFSDPVVSQLEYENDVKLVLRLISLLISGILESINDRDSGLLGYHNQLELRSRNPRKTTIVMS